ncbi:MAG: hypothetical protein ACR2QQ_08665 [Gammaproteobacteria bacterium]
MTMRAANARVLGLTTITMLCLIAEAWPQPTSGQDPPILNSERISQRFGSYGIEILDAFGNSRISNLFSDEDGVAITRTFAIVEFQSAAKQGLSREHEAVLAGESIGEALVSRGWVVVKSNRYIGLLPSTPRTEALMHLSSTAVLAAHIYELRATRIDQIHHYATIVEIHHPEYLRLSDLIEIYGEVEITAGVEPLLALAWQKMN